MNIDNYSKKIKQINPPKQSYVAFLDLLGFGKLVLDKDHDEIRALYQGIIRSNLDLSLTETAEQGKSESEWIKAVDNSKDYSDIEPKLIDVSLSSVSISDSILLSTPDDSFKSLITLIATVRNLMAKLLFHGFPLRGAIAHGVITNDWQIEESNKNIIHHQMLGAPIVHAERLEKMQNWSGCVLHSSILEPSMGKLGPMMPTYITLYDVPLKKYTKEGIQHSNEAMPVISWPHGIYDTKQTMDEDHIRSAFEMHGKTINDDVREMIENTILYYRDAIAHPPYEVMKQYFSEHPPK